MRDEESDDLVYVILLNGEEQYSIWPSFKDVPSGWKKVGKEGSKSECIAYIDEVWTDMRPLSLRMTMSQ